MEIRELIAAMKSDRPQLEMIVEAIELLANPPKPLAKEDPHAGEPVDTVALVEAVQSKLQAAELKIESMETRLAAREIRDEAVKSKLEAAEQKIESLRLLAAQIHTEAEFEKSTPPKPPQQKKKKK